MGIDAVAGVLMLATNRRASWRSRPRAAAAKRPGCKRFQALLLGEVPRMEQVLMDARRQARGGAGQGRRAPLPVMMKLKDFVPVDEVTRSHNILCNQTKF
ncbi:hypothetical protein PR003_g3073 [Phytophthora rubi]|uniref:Uncharacterized protein n=1 Tax=Phytophthora rubi TaxID=129364 RepID=A0A6A4FWI5_9STRA|nr:hypothetical protein PR002_g15346 [Phytophthora rubi]KAE9046203.1 hypothetical protein PR001_g4662 [Phytophthora rubi]KAE9354992.1 hypothetical protein PR003_g3073 [Phytophthora rubi]